MAEGNGHIEARLERLTAIVLDLGESHEKLLSSQQHLLFAQGVLCDQMTKLSKRVDHLGETVADLAEAVAEAQRDNNEQFHKLHTDDRLNARIHMFDEWIRRQPQPLPGV